MSATNTEEEMTRDRFQAILDEVKEGRNASIEAFFKQLFTKSIRQLQKFTHSRSEAQEAFSEVIVKFWMLFVEGNKPLPESNIDGYIFTMAKMHCLEKYRRKNKHRVLSLEEVASRAYEIQDDAKTQVEFFQQQEQEELEQEAFSQALQKLGQNCRTLFQMILDTGLDKPRDLWQPLGYKNARTLSSLKDQCLKKLKRNAAFEFEMLQQNPQNHKHNANHPS